MYGQRIGGDSLSQGTVVILEEVVEDAARGRTLGLDVHYTHQLRRVYDQIACLLGDDVPAAQRSYIVDFVINALTMELDGVRSIGLLAPEPVKIRELRIFVAPDVYALVKLQGSGERLPDYCPPLADAQFHKHVAVGH